MSISFLRLIRVIRLIRITRLVRLVRLVEELGTIMSSILASLTALFWTLLLLMMLMYVVSVFFTQIILELDEDAEHVEEIRYWYGRLPRSMLTMFECIAGGVSWDEVVTPLIQDISPFVGVVFAIYIAFCVFAMLNMATGVFVDRAITKAQEDTDAYTANHISDLFFTDVGDGVSFDEFSDKMEAPEMQEYFKSINVDPSEAKTLFALLDFDGSGTINPDELVNGCLRLRGSAKSLDMCQLIHGVNQMHKDILQNQCILVSEIGKLEKTLGPRRNDRLSVE
mmetsp:Transcript_152775/g.265427  ORF Transcript_152775/g.265427 Transcript_152775/m.265427 type:complete len:281 (+) Transcript_152775:37-879(+)